MLFYIEYGCSQNKETLIIDAENKTQAENFAELCAEEEFDSYDHSADIGTEDDYETIREYDAAYYEAMRNDIYYTVEEFDDTNYIHQVYLKQMGVYEV